MQRVGLPEDPYTLHSVVNNLFVDRSLVRVVVPAPTFDFFFFFLGGACNVPIAVPMRCHRCSSAPSYQVGTFHRARIGVGKVVELVVPPESNTVAVSEITTLASRRSGPFPVRYPPRWTTSSPGILSAIPPIYSPLDFPPNITSNLRPGRPKLPPGELLRRCMYRLCTRASPLTR